ncbi:MAG: Mobile element protein, partial [Olavius algarvensis Gamma 1 endosymbiont]
PGRCPAFRARCARTLGGGESTSLASRCGLLRGCEPHPQRQSTRDHDDDP